jgi:hypothetical protein
MTVDFGSMFPSPFAAGDLNRGLAGVTVRFAATPSVPAVAKARPVTTVPQPMVRFVGLTNRQSLLDAFIANEEPADSAQLDREQLACADRYVDSWLKRNGGEESRLTKGRAALTVLRAHQETSEVLFVLRNAWIAV